VVTEESYETCRFLDLAKLQTDLVGELLQAHNEDRSKEDILVIKERLEKIQTVMARRIGAVYSGPTHS
jgi:hypothetical protein